MGAPHVIVCSFCNKTQTEVKQIIAGPTPLFICDECVCLCVDVLREKGIELVPVTGTAAEKTGRTNPEDPAGK